MTGIKSKKEISESKGRNWLNWRNKPSTSRDPPEPPEEDETERILPSPPQSPMVDDASVENQALEKGAIENPAGEDPSAEDSSVQNTGRTKAKKTKNARSFLERHRVCLCMVYQCGGYNRTCGICFQKKMAGYQKMENDQFRAELPEASEKIDSLLVNFFLDKTSLKEYSTILVTPNTTSYDAVKGVAVIEKNEDYHRYAVVEFWKDYEAERVLDEHELIADVRREQFGFYVNGMKFMLHYRLEFEKYDYITNKEDYFIHPSNLKRISLDSPSKTKEEDPRYIQIRDPFFSRNDKIFITLYLKREQTSQDVVESSSSIQPAPEEPADDDDLVNPIFCSTIWVKESKKDLTIPQIQKLTGQKEKSFWRKKYLLLRDRTLYFVETHSNMIKCYYHNNEKFREMLNTQTSEQQSEGKKTKKAEVTLIGPIADFQIYSGLSVAKYYNAPYSGGIYLKEQDGACNRPIRLMFCCKICERNRADPTSFNRKLWLTAMRLAKHGAKIKDNYLEYLQDKNEYNYKISIRREANNPRVPMDFTYGKGRVVDDPEEAAQIARGECGGSSITARTPRFQSLVPAPEDSLAFGPHLTQGYYHRNLSREQAEEMIIRTGTNGAFILRDSKNRPGCLVLTYLHALRPHHQYVTPVVMHDKIKGEDILLATCDKDIVFYDVHSLIEYHRLNKGSLQCALTVSIHNPQQPDNTPPRHRKPTKSRTSSPQPGPSGIRIEVSSPAQGVSPSPEPPGDSERERRSLSPLQMGSADADTSSETASAEHTSSKSNLPQTDLLTSLEIHPEPISSSIPCLSPSPRSSSSASSRKGGPSPTGSCRDEASPRSSPSHVSHDQCSDSPLA